MLTSGLGEMGSAQPIAITANGGVVIIADVNRNIIKRRLISSVIDIKAESVEEACEIAKDYIKKRRTYIHWNTR